MQFLKFWMGLTGSYTSSVLISVAFPVYSKQTNQVSLSIGLAFNEHRLLNQL